MSWLIVVLYSFKVVRIVGFVLGFMGFGLGKFDGAKMVFLDEFLGFTC